MMVPHEIERPVRVIILALLILVMAANNGLRLGEALFFWRTLEEYGAHPLYISMSGGAWLIIGLFLAWGLWQGKGWGRIAAMIGSAGYTAWYWCDRLILEKPHANWMFVLITNIIFLIVFFTILLSNRTKKYFKRNV